MILAFRVQGNAERFLQRCPLVCGNLPSRRDIAVIVLAPEADERFARQHAADIARHVGDVFRRLRSGWELSSLDMN